MNLDDVIAVVNSESAATLCLSKGGWEGWLQCELWRYLSIEKGETVEREVPYPDPFNAQRCDLVASYNQQPLWVEIKAFGAFRQGDENRFLTSIANDIQKLDVRPAQTNGLALAVVPKAISQSFIDALMERRLTGFEFADTQYAMICHLSMN